MNNAQFTPSSFLKQILSNRTLMRNETASNTRECYQNGDTAGLEMIARNLCETRGMNYDEIKSQVMIRHGLK